MIKPRIRLLSTGRFTCWAPYTKLGYGDSIPKAYAAWKSKLKPNNPPPKPIK